MRKLMVATSLLGFFFIGTARAASCTIGPSITCGSAVTGSISPTGATCVIDTFPTAIYTFFGTAGQVLDLTASNNSGYSIGLSVTDPNGQSIAYGFDEPASAHAVITKSGTHVISLNYGNPHQSGPFTLTLSCSTSTTPPPAQCVFSGTVAVGSTVTDKLTASDTACGYSASYGKAYKLIANAGDTFGVNIASPNFQPYVEIQGPDASAGYRWARKPESALLTYYVAPTSGDITIYVMSNNGSPVTGAFTMLILPYAQPPCGKSRAVRP